MGLSWSLAAIALLIAASAFFSIAEISMAASRRLRLRQMAAEGDARAQRVLDVQQQPGNYFTVVQIGQNMVAISPRCCRTRCRSPPPTRWAS
jgi:CBS domain containing-hemolysin-like protein